MRTTTRLTLAAAAVGSGFLFAATPALAQTAPCVYPFDCPVAPGGGTTPTTTPPTTTPPTTTPPTTTPPTTTGTGGGTNNAGGGSPSVSSPAVLPFTGGELVVMTATGAGALAAGTVLLVAGRRRHAKA